MNEVLATLNSRDFEHFIADLWQYQGWETEVTSSTGDRGIDVIAERSFPYSETCLIQAKCYSPSNKIGSEEVRKYATLEQQEDADTIIIATSSEFTSPAQSLGEDLGMKLINGEQLLGIVDEIDARDLLREYFEDQTRTTSAHSTSGSQANRSVGGRNTNRESKTVMREVEVASNIRTVLQLHRRHALSKLDDPTQYPVLFMLRRRGQFVEDYAFDVGIHYVLCRDAEEREALGDLIGRKGLTVQNTDEEESGTRVIFTRPNFRGEDFDIDEEYDIIESVMKTVYGLDLAYLPRVAFHKNPNDKVDWETDDSPRETVDGTELDADCPECESNLFWNPHRGLGECQGCGIDLKFQDGEWRSIRKDTGADSDTSNDSPEVSRREEDADDAEAGSSEESQQSGAERDREEASPDEGRQNEVEEINTDGLSSRGNQTRTVEQQSKTNTREQDAEPGDNELSLLERISNLFRS